MRYVCPECGSVWEDGFAVGPGPWCGKCGTEMVLEHPPECPGKTRPKRKSRFTTPPQGPAT